MLPRAGAFAAAAAAARWPAQAILAGGGGGGSCCAPASAAVALRGRLPHSGLRALSERATQAAAERLVPPKEALAAAVRAGTAAVGFSAGGWLFSYYVGVLKGLLAAGAIRESTPMAGASAGAIIAAVFHCGLPLKSVEASMYRLADDCRRARCVCAGAMWCVGSAFQPLSSAPRFPFAAERSSLTPQPAAAAAAPATHTTQAPRHARPAARRAGRLPGPGAAGGRGGALQRARVRRAHAHAALLAAGAGFALRIAGGPAASAAGQRPHPAVHERPPGDALPARPLLIAAPLFAVCPPARSPAPPPLPRPPRAQRLTASLFIPL